MAPPAGEPCGLLWDVLREFPLGEAFGFAAPEPPLPRPPQPGGWEAEAADSQPASGPVAGCEGELCHSCRLPLGSFRYPGEEPGQLLHGQCKAQLVLEKARADEGAQLERDARLKERHRTEYGIGWRVEMIPEVARAAAKLGCRELQGGMCCVVLADDASSVRLAPTSYPAAAINPEYLSIALRVRREEGREPFFSLDPQRRPLSTADGREVRWQVKRFEPAWLDGTSAGEVLFQADYHLKELSMGERRQPVVGMRSCLDLAGDDAGRFGAGWQAREWFVVRGAELQLAEDGALVPRVRMGVEARELAPGPDGLEDAALAAQRLDHPLARYAGEFTRHFDLIAERRSAVRHLRELARASVVAKFLLESGARLEEAWFRLAREGGAAGGQGGGGAAGLRGPATIPQLWNERSCSQVCVRDGQILNSGTISGTSVHGVYGGVQLSLEQLNVSKKTLQPLGIPSWFPKGVDLSLDTFNLSAPTGAAGRGPRGHVPCGAAFWSGIDVCPQLQGEAERFFGELFNPHLADRREEGDKFVPPDSSPAYVHGLRASLREEEEVRRRREHHFLSEEFAAERPGPLFPAAVAAAAAAPPPSGGARGRTALHLRPDLEAEALCLLWQQRASAPLFDCSVEDGTRYRAYRAGGLELRTVQGPRGPERLGAALAPDPAWAAAPAPAAGTSALSAAAGAEPAQASGLSAAGAPGDYDDLNYAI